MSYFSDSFEGASLGPALQKYRYDGAVMWTVPLEMTLGGPEEAGSIYTPGTSGDFFIVGQKRLQFGNYDAYVARYDTEGSQRWLKTFGGINAAEKALTAVADIGSDVVYVTGVISATSREWQRIGGIAAGCTCAAQQQLTPRLPVVSPA